MASDSAVQAGSSHRKTEGPSKMTENCSGDTQHVLLRKVVYQKRKFNRDVVVDRASKWQTIFNEGGANQGSTIRYNFFVQNCEHFACACANGPEGVDKPSLKKSMSVQAQDLLWIAISVVFWALQGIFFGFNFWMYAVFVQRDCDYKFLSTHTYLLKKLCGYCYTSRNMRCRDFVGNYTDPALCIKLSENKPHGFKHFETTCDWMIIGLLVVVFLIMSAAIVLFYYRAMKNENYMCKKCYDTVCIHQLFSRNMAFILIEVINIVSEDFLYNIVICWKLSRLTTILTLIAVSTIGALCVYSLASMITRVIVICCSSDHSSVWRWSGLWKCAPKCLKNFLGCFGCCSGCKSCSYEKGHDKFVPFRGFLRCCFANTKSKYLNRNEEESGEGCMVCRMEIPIYDFHDLQPGDHISMPGAAPFFNYLYNHHAIVASVDDISRGGKEAIVKVIDVPRKGMNWAKCARMPLPIEHHSLYDMGRQRLTSSRWIHGHLENSGASV